MSDVQEAAAEAAREELEDAEAAILTWYRDMAEGNAGNIIPVFMAVARSVHRASGMLKVAGGRTGIHRTDEADDSDTANPYSGPHEHGSD